MYSVYTVALMCFGSDGNGGAGSEAANALVFSCGGKFSEILSVPDISSQV